MLVIIFWATLYLLFRFLRAESNENNYVKGILILPVLIHIFYEGIYKEHKIKSKRKEVKEKHLRELKSNLVAYTPKIATAKLPHELQTFIPIIEKWGIENKLLRENLYEHASQEELLALKQIENSRESFENWVLEHENDETTTKAIEMTLQSYNDLGLWTWKTQ